ncbi:MAG: hypothetical protein RBT11_17365 [Desulfobacterales bacterium]|jgi:hypothetical protein|nr:hypothetical protein [Desulfobacterales bacterium]
MTYTCKNCGAMANSPGHLCNPCDEKEKCSFCGTLETDPKHMCKDKLSAMNFVCDGCGRLSIESEHLCAPQPIQ